MKRFQTYECSVCGNTVEVAKVGGGTLVCCEKPMQLQAESQGKDEPHVIIGVHITDRVKKVPGVQAVFTKYGCSIKTRLGLHHTSESFCSPNGLMLIEFVGDEATRDSMVAELADIEGIEVKGMVFGHP